MAALAQVQEDEAAKQARIEQYQDRRIVVEVDPEDKNPQEAKRRLLLRQGPDRIYQVDFVQLMDDPSLTGYWERERNKEWALWLGTGATGIPLGTVLFLQNFRGEGGLAPFTDASRPQAANAGDLRGYSLSVLGAGLALYGAYNLGLWIAENLDLLHPERLENDSIGPRARAWNDTLAERLNLDPSDLPSPPTPRPSPSPSPTPSLFEDETAASPPVGGPDGGPYGGPPPAMPTPLPLAQPGVVPSALVASPSPRPSIFQIYPGPAGYPVPSLRPGGVRDTSTPEPEPSAPPSAAPAPAPSPSRPPRAGASASPVRVLATPPPGGK